jgi:hypothetical protein
LANISKQGRFTNQGFFNNRFIPMLSNGDFTPRDVLAHDHLNKIRTDTSILINGAGLVLEFSKFTQPNELIKNKQGQARHGAKQCKYNQIPHNLSES